MKDRDTVTPAAAAVRLKSSAVLMLVGAGRFLQRVLQAILDEVPLGPKDGGGSHIQSLGDILMTVSPVGGEQDQGALDLADSGAASIDQFL